MSMLSEFLRTLKPNEIAVVKQMHTSKRENEVLQQTIAHLLDKTFDDELVQNELHLSKSHFDKINSVLLDKCYNTLTNGTNHAVLYLLWEKGQKTLLLHEAKVRERKLIKGNSKNLAEFYKLMFDICVRLPVLNGKIVMAEQYGNKHLRALGKPTTEKRSEIWLQYLFATIFYYSANGKMNEYGPWTLAELEKWKKKLSGKEYPVCQFFYHLSLASYYEFYTSDFEKLMQSLQASLKALQYCEERVSENYRIYVETKMANAYCHGSMYGLAMQTYSECFKKYEKALLRNRYHPLMYSVVAILNNELSEAEKMMNNHLRFYLDNTPSDTFNFDIERIYAVLYMYKKDYEKAAYYLQRGQQWDKTKFTFLGDVLQRIVQNIYFILTQDYEMAHTLLRTNKRFLQSKPQDEMTREYGQMFEVIADVLRQKTGKAMSKDFANHYKAVQQGIMKLYSGLLTNEVAL